MQTGLRKIAAIGTALCFILVAACSPGDRAPQLDDSPESMAFQYRDGLMHVISWRVAQLRGMTDGEVPQDDETFVRNARELATLSGMINEGFPPGSNVPGSRALPEIWEHWDDFVRRTEEMQTAADALVAAAENGGVAGSGNALRSLAQTCGNCHRTYRAPD
jgi:cytochrome c556